MASSSGDCCCNLCCKLVKFIFSVGLSIFIFWLIFRPHEIRANVVTASLPQFAFSNATGALDYVLLLDISFRNPNRRIGVYYDRLEATAYYADASLGGPNDTLPAFFQHTKTTTVVHVAFQGKSTSLTSSSAPEAYAKERTDGYFNLDVKLNGKLRYKVWFVKVHGFRPKIDCVLRIPAPTNRSSPQFEGTKCHVNY